MFNIIRGRDALKYGHMAIDRVRVGYAGDSLACATKMKGDEPATPDPVMSEREIDYGIVKTYGYTLDRTI